MVGIINMYEAMLHIHNQISAQQKALHVVVHNVFALLDKGFS